MILQTNIYIQKLISAAELLIGTALTAAAFGLIILPQDFAAAGVTGFARTITHIIPLNFLDNSLSFLRTGLEIFKNLDFKPKTGCISCIFRVNVLML